MKRLILALIFLLSPVSTWSATITTTGSGDYSSTTPNAPWPSGTIPTSGSDRVIVANGHTLTISDTRTVGDGTDSITINSGGTVNQTSGTLTLDGNFNMMAETVNAASTFNQSAGVTLDAQSFSLLIGHYTSSATGRALWYANGTSGSRVNLIGTTGNFSYTGIAQSGISWEYVTIDGFLHTTNANRLACNSSSLTTNIFHCIFKNTVSWVFGAGGGDRAHKISYCDFRAITGRNPGGVYSTAGVQLYFGNINTATDFTHNTYYGVPTAIYNNTKTSNMSYSVFYDIPIILGAGTVTIGNSLFYLPTGSTAGSVVSAASAGGLIMSDNLFISDKATSVHGLILPASTTAGIYSKFWNNVFVGASAEDNFIYGGKNTPTDIYNNITIGKGALYVSLTNTVGYSPLVQVYNNTCAAVSGVYGNCWYCETAHSVEYDLVKNNLVYIPNGTTGDSTAFSSAIAAQADELNYSGYNAFYSFGNASFDRYRNIIMSDWTVGDTPTYTSTSAFTVPGDQTATYATGVRLEINNSGVLKTTTVASSSYSAPNTTVNTGSAFVGADITGVKYSAGTNYETEGAGIFGGTDITAEINPNFVDVASTPENYAISKGATGTTAEVHTWLLEELCKINGYDKAGTATSSPNWFVSDVNTYVFNGYTPTNMALLTAGESGTYIGAVEPAAATDDYYPAALMIGM